MVARLAGYVLLGLTLLLVFTTSALLAMRLAIHGREVRVPKLTGLMPAEADRVVKEEGLVLSVESRFYTPSVPEGRIISQSPLPGARVRRGWQVLVAQSLGQQRATIPSLIGQSQHAANLNASRRNLEIGSVATMHFPGAVPGAIVAQDPPPEAHEVSSPRINLLVAVSHNVTAYVMPSFLGKQLGVVTEALKNAGFAPGHVRALGDPGGEDVPSRPFSKRPASSVVVRQHPLPGQRVFAGTKVDLEVRR